MSRNRLNIGQMPWKEKTIFEFKQFISYLIHPFFQQIIKLNYHTPLKNSSNPYLNRPITHSHPITHPNFPITFKTLKISTPTPSYDPWRKQRVK